MKFNKLILVSLLVMVLFALSAVSATDEVNSTELMQSADVNDDLTVMDDGIDETLQVNSEESTSIVITSETFSSYFDGEGRLLDSVSEGSTLDFQGSIESSDNIKAIYINKSVNIISSTKDGTITLNTVNGTLGIEHIANRFIVCNASSITIKDVVFNRTQMLIYDSSDVVLDNIGVISDHYKICQPAIPNERKTSLLELNNVNGFTLKDSYLYVYNLGASVINCIGTKEVLFDNNTFCGYADSNNTNESFAYMILFSEEDTSFNFTNNNVHANATHGYFANILASHILFENNTMEHIDGSDEYTSYAMGTTLGKAGKSYSIVRNNVLVKLEVNGNSTIYNNIVEFNLVGGMGLVYNNTIFLYNKSTNPRHRGLTIIRDCIAYNNTVNGYVQISGARNSILKDSRIGGIISQRDMRNIIIENNVVLGNVDIEAADSYIHNNTIKGNMTIMKDNWEIKDNIIEGSVYLSSKLSVIRNNVIHSSIDYAIALSGMNNEVYNNKLYSRLYCGNNAVSYATSDKNYIEDNTPTQDNIFLNMTVNTLDYGENTEIIVNMPNINANVTIDVDGRKYVVGLVNGTASKLINEYGLGINNVAVIYEDTVNDVWATNHTTFTVNKAAYCPIGLVYDNNVFEGKSFYVDVILPDDAEGTIFISLTNGIYTLDIKEVANGRVNKISLPGLYESNHTILATFTSDKYVSNSTTANLSVVHIPVYNLTSGDVVMDYKDGSKYKVLVTKDGETVGAGEIVKITFNGATKNVKTDDDGYATLTLDGAPKTYMIKAEYNGVAKSTKVTIKNILKASNISKKKAKQIKFSATLKNSKGKAIVGKKITFKFKGKTYSAKTNKKGVATITLKNLKVGKYTITSKYGVCSVKNTITIKK